jgi:AraC-like DNA-binding protein
MFLKEFLPRAECGHLVRYYRLVRFVLDSTTEKRVKVYVPRPEVALSFMPRDLEAADYFGRRKLASSCVLTGQHDCSFARIVPNDFLFAQVVFQPAALYRLTGIPAGDLRNGYFDAYLVFSKDIRHVTEQLFHARSQQEMLDVLDSFVLSLTPRYMPSAIDAVSSLLLQRAAPSLDWLARESSLSVRQFERRFKAQVGVSPKLFARLYRFDRAFRMKNQHPHLDWLTIAVACGYYDYQHLVRDYKDFTGTTPTASYEVDKTAPERAFGLVEGYAETRPENL